MPGELLKSRIDALMGALVRRFENIIALAGAEALTLPITAYQANMIDIETSALVRAAEEVLMLTRQMKQLWLIGSLNADREASPLVQKQEEDRRALVEQVEKLLESVYSVPEITDEGQREMQRRDGKEVTGVGADGRR